MGRPWWYDSYWEKKGSKKRKRYIPGGPLFSWLILLLVALLLTFWRIFR